MQTCCACPQCRAMIREEILSAFDSQPRWMGKDTIRYYGLGWIPNGLYLEVLEEMCHLGLLIHSTGHGFDFPRYLPSRLIDRPGSISGNKSNLRRPLDPPEGGADVA